MVTAIVEDRPAGPARRGSGRGASDAPASGDRPTARRGGRFAAHVAGLAAVLLLGVALVRPGVPTLSDEGAALAQVDALANGPGWLVDHPLPQADPTGTAFPIDLSSRRSASLQFAPLAKHPVFAGTLLLPYLLAGAAGAFVVPLAGALTAAVAAARLSRRLRLGDERVVLWLVGAGSPLLFDAMLLIAHTVGAALATGALVLVLRRRPVAVAAGLGCLLAAQLLRNEAVLFGVALALALALNAARPGGRRSDAGLAAAVLATTAFAYRLDEWLAARILGPEATAPFGIAHEGSFVEGRLTGAFNALARPPDAGTLGRLALLGVLVALVVGARRAAGGRDPRGVTVAAGAAAGLALVAVVAAPTALVPGLFLAAPVLVCGLVALDRATLTGRPVPVGPAAPTGAAGPAAASNGGGAPDGAAVLVAGCTLVLFVLAVLATQYADAGNSWGGRFLALGIPLLGPFAAAGLGRLHAAVPAGDRRVLTGSLVVVSVALGAMAWGSIRADQRAAVAVDDLVVTATDGLTAGDGDLRPVVVATEKGFGRLLWPRVRDQRWLLVPVDGLADRGPLLRAAGIERLALLTPDPAAAAAALAPWYDAAGPPVRTVVRSPGQADTVLAPAAVVLVAR